MITGFEKHTARLTDDEMKLVRGFTIALERRVGKKNAVTSSYIIKEYKKQGVKISGPRVRKIINYIRMNNLVPGLIASSQGYYVTDDPEELKGYIESLEGRLSSIAGILRMTKQKYKEIITADQQNISYGQN